MAPFLIMDIIAADNVDIGAGDKIVADLDSTGIGRNKTAVGEPAALANAHPAAKNLH